MSRNVLPTILKHAQHLLVGALGLPLQHDIRMMWSYMNSTGDMLKFPSMNYTVTEDTSSACSRVANSTISSSEWRQLSA